MLPIQPKGGAAEAHEDGNDPRARLRAAREGLARGSRKAWVLPGYDSDNPMLGGAELVVWYKRLTFEELRQLAKGQGQTAEPDFVAVNAQFLVNACDDIALREADGTVVPLVQGHKTTFTVNLDTNESLGTFLGVEELPSIRAQLVAAFGGNEHVLNDHSGEVHRWMVAANQVDEDSLGEPLTRQP